MFIRELNLYVDYLRDEIDKFSAGILSRAPRYFREFKENLLKGIEYYQGLADQFAEEQRQRFLNDLKRMHEVIEPIRSGR